MPEHDRKLLEQMLAHLDVARAAEAYIVAAAKYIGRPVKPDRHLLLLSRFGVQELIDNPHLRELHSDSLEAKAAYFAWLAKDLASEARQYRRMERVLRFVFGGFRPPVEATQKDGFGAIDPSIAFVLSLVFAALWMAVR